MNELGWFDSATGEVKLTDTALTLPDHMPYDDWVAYGQKLKQMAHAAMWWIGDWWVYGQREYGDGPATAALTGYSYKTCAMAGSVARKFESSRRLEDVPWEHHLTLCAKELTDADRQELLNEWAAALPTVAQARAEVNAIKRDRRRPQFDTPTVDLIDAGPFNVLYADPPWRYDFSPTDTRAIENQYPTMALEDICALQPPALDDAVLFLWGTSPKLAEAMEILPAWNFEYRTTMVWVKDKIGMGYYAREQHELLLIAKRGDIAVPEPADRPSSVVYADRTEHSAKPEVFYELIETMYPGHLYGEIFARRPRDGWGSWGNQI